MSVRTLIFDPFAGISGDMTLAALLDLGLDEAWLHGFVSELGVGNVSVHIERVSRCGIAAPHITFGYPAEQAHRHLHHIEAIIDACVAPDRAKQLARATFARIAEAEARVHGTTIERVHFHEVGAMDAILDVVCVMAAVCELGFEDFRTRPVAVGSGWIDIEHGRYPVPAPATLGILAGVPLTGTDLAGECTTPTGAAIVAVLTGGRGAPARFTVRRTGFGAGTRDPQDRPNVLRLLDADTAATGLDADAETDTDMWLIQADVDDLPAEYAAAAQAALHEAGAADVVLHPVSMKKGRPGVRIEVLASAARLETLEHTLLVSTSTIGLRRWPVQRTVLPREWIEREWRGQRIRFKRVTLPDGTTREKPEYDDVVRAADALGLNPWQVRSQLG